MRRQIRNPIPPNIFQFDQQSIIRLGNLDLSPQAIQELKDVACSELAWIMFIRKKPPKKQITNELKKLRKTLEDVEETYSNLHSLTLRNYIGFQRYRLRPIVAETIEYIDKCLEEKGSPGNVETDLDALAYSTAAILIKDGLKIKKQGRLLKEVLEVVFYSIGEDPAGIDSAIKKAWNSTPEKKDWYVPYRPYSIKELIERTELGLGDDE